MWEERRDTRVTRVVIEKGLVAEIRALRGRHRLLPPLKKAKYPSKKGTKWDRVRPLVETAPPVNKQ